MCCTAAACMLCDTSLLLSTFSCVAGDMALLSLPSPAHLFSLGGRRGQEEHGSENPTT